MRVYRQSGHSDSFTSYLRWSTASEVPKLVSFSYIRGHPVYSSSSQFWNEYIRTHVILLSHSEVPAVFVPPGLSSSIQMISLILLREEWAEKWSAMIREGFGLVRTRQTNIPTSQQTIFQELSRKDQMITTIYLHTGTLSKKRFSENGRC